MRIPYWKKLWTTYAKSVSVYVRLRIVLGRGV
jgi:hypothetical protein